MPKDINSNLNAVTHELDSQAQLITELMNLKQQLIEQYGEIFYTRAFIRVFCNFGEACNLLRTNHDHALVKAFQNNDSNGELIPKKFAWFRNQFLHHYLYDSLEGNKSLLEEAESYFNSHFPSIKQAFKNCRDFKEQVIALEEIKLTFTQTVHKPDFKFSKTGDYVHMLDKELDQFKVLLQILNLDPNKLSQNLFRFHLKSALATNKYLLFVLQNFVENICGMLLDLNSVIILNKQQATRNLCQSKIDKDLKYFLCNKIGDIKKDIAHRFANQVSVSDIEKVANNFVFQITKFLLVKQQYLLALEKALDPKQDYTPGLLSHSSTLSFSSSCSSSSSLSCNSASSFSNLSAKAPATDAIVFGALTTLKRKASEFSSSLEDDDSNAKNKKSASESKTDIKHPSM